MSTYNWTIYQDGNLFYSGTTSSSSLIETLPNSSITRCHSAVTWTIECYDDSGNTASEDINMIATSSCIPTSGTYTYHIASNKGTYNGGYSGNCSGGNASFWAVCDNTSQTEPCGTWTILKEGNMIYAPRFSCGHLNYSFSKNETYDNIEYELLYNSECGESATTKFTLIPSISCIPCGTYNLVDFGLPSETLWCDINVSACHLDDSGDFYAWGGHNGSDESSSFTLNNYDLYSGSTYIKYNISDLIKVIENDEDIAHLAMSLTIPSPYHFKELLSGATITSSSGLIKIEKNGKSIKLPKVGYLKDSSTIDASNAYYWTSYLDMNNPSDTDAIGMKITTAGGTNVSIPRYSGLQIRPIQEKTVTWTVTAYKYRTSDTSNQIKSLMIRLSKGGDKAELNFEVNAYWAVPFTINVGKIYDGWNIASIYHILTSNGYIDGGITYSYSIANRQIRINYN